MARAIDGELLELEIANIANKLAKSDAQKALMGRVMYCVEHMPTLTPPNEWVNRVRELDELYTKLQIVTGFTAGQLLEIFAAGYTLEKPDYSKKFAEMENLAEAADAGGTAGDGRCKCAMGTQSCMGITQAPFHAGPQCFGRLVDVL